MRITLLVAVLLVVTTTPATVMAAADGARMVGVAAVDITPDYAIRLNGFGHRRSESEGITAKIWAKSIAIDDGDGKLSVLITADNLGIPDYMTIEVVKRLKDKAKLDPTRLSISSSHTHTAPMLTNCCPTIFGMPLTADEQAHIDRYTHELTDHLEEVALAAIADLRPGTLEWGLGTVDFATNRRTPGGPVDHDLPLMLVKGADGKPRAIWVSYACHCVTLSNNKISGDWAGFVQQLVQSKYPGVIALTSIGCGADANPSSGVTGDKVDIAQQQGMQVAKEVDRLMQSSLTPLTAPIATTYQRISLPFDLLPTREQWEARAKLQNTEGYHARVNLARLDRGEKLQTEISYPIQTWTFGDQLAMVFLPGEVVVDYSLRLKKEFDRNRLWINAYANDVPCYIPSERILREGGYEGGGAMVYYDRPAPLKSGVEKLIIDEVHRQVPKTFEAPKGTEGVAPRTAEQSLRTIRTRPGLEVELVAAEPLVTSPVAIDWSADGRMWVCEMFDYPTGANKNWEPGGRVRVLADTDGDGRYDKSTIFLDPLPFPTGVTAWGRGVFICAAPDIIYAEDTDGDGKADKVERRYTGFATDNYQARVNSLSLGLDNWIYGANGLLGGVIKGPKGELDIRGHDFRIRRSDGLMETVGGNTQQGRARDDWGRWFGCDNSNALFYYPYEQRYFQRNPHAPSPPPVLNPRPGGNDFDVTRIYPISHPTERFNHPDSLNHTTAACGLGVYRDTLLGDGYYGNTFTCEPVHNLVHRLVLSGDGTKLKRARADGEAQGEFFASSDNWSRPVQAKTGPDGALYVVDMYRFMIEHPRWIPAERLAQLDVRAGAEMGRIYRVKPAGDVKLRAVRDLTKLTTEQLAEALNTPNGTERDRVQIELLSRKDAAAAAPILAKVATDAQEPATQVQALSALDGVGAITPQHVAAALKDRDERVRQQAVRLSETHRDANVETALLALVGDSSPIVRTQLAFSLGEWDDPRAGEGLAKLAIASLNDADLRAAVLSSASHHCGPILAAVMSAGEGATGRDAWIPPLVATAAASSDAKLLATALGAVLPKDGVEPGAAHFEALSGLLEALDRKQSPVPEDAKPRVARVRDAARSFVADANASAEARSDAITLLGFGQPSPEELDALCRLVTDGD
jgi:putative membrane-bound dehydrogenase-like protein